MLHHGTHYRPKRCPGGKKTHCESKQNCFKAKLNILLELVLSSYSKKAVVEASITLLHVILKSGLFISIYLLHVRWIGI